MPTKLDASSLSRVMSFLSRNDRDELICANSEIYLHVTFGRHALIFSPRHCFALVVAQIRHLTLHVDCCAKEGIRIVLKYFTPAQLEAVCFSIQRVFDHETFHCVCSVIVLNCYFESESVNGLCHMISRCANMSLFELNACEWKCPENLRMGLIGRFCPDKGGYDMYRPESSELDIVHRLHSDLFTSCHKVVVTLTQHCRNLTSLRVINAATFACMWRPFSDAIGVVSVKSSILSILFATAPSTTKQIVLERCGLYDAYFSRVRPIWQPSAPTELELISLPDNYLTDVGLVYILTTDPSFMHVGQSTTLKLLNLQGNRISLFPFTLSVLFECLELNPQLRIDLCNNPIRDDALGVIEEHPRILICNSGFIHDELQSMTACDSEPAELADDNTSMFDTSDHESVEFISERTEFISSLRHVTSRSQVK